MDNLINELITVLDQEARVYENILRMSKNKTNIIVEGKVVELDNIVKLEQSLVLQMGRLEKLREELVEKLAGEIGIKPLEVTISELMKHINSERAQRLKACQDKLSTTVNELKDTNGINAKLIQNSLDYINFSINLIATADVGNNNYGNKGQVNDSKKRSLFDVKL